MDEIIIKVGDPWHNTCLGKQEAMDLFKDIPNDVDKIVFNFGNILYVGCLFVKKYLLLKKSIDVKIDEINVWERVQKSFDIIESFGVDCSDDELIQKFIEYEL